MPKILIIRFSSIGDIVLTTAAVRCAKNQIPGVEIHFLTKLSMKDLVIGNPNIDQFHFLDENIDHTIAALKDGGFVISWMSVHQDGSDWGVYEELIHSKNLWNVSAFK